MADGVATRLQKDLERIDTRIDEKLEKWGDKFRNDLFAELKDALEHINMEIGSLK